MFAAKTSPAQGGPLKKQPAHTPLGKGPAPHQIFGDTPDTNFFYDAGPHRPAFASLVHAIDCGRGFVTLTGKPGTGKTTLLFRLLEHYRNTACTVFIYQTQFSTRDLLRLLLADASQESDTKDPVRMQLALNDLLLKVHRQRKRFIVVIDEGQNLSANTLESLRLLSDFETPKEKLLQLVLCGQPRLEERLFSPDQSQLRQRISTFCRLRPLTPQETFDYIEHRWKRSEIASPLPFTPSALAAIANFSEGIPRNIHRICFSALWEANAKGLQIIDDDLIVKSVCTADSDEPGEESLGTLSPPHRSTRPTSPLHPAVDAEKTPASPPAAETFTEQLRESQNNLGSSTGFSQLVGEPISTAAPEHEAREEATLNWKPSSSNLVETGPVVENSKEEKPGPAAAATVAARLQSESDLVAWWRERTEQEFRAANQSKPGKADSKSSRVALRAFVVVAFITVLLGLMGAVALFGPKFIERYKKLESSGQQPSTAADVLAPNSSSSAGSSSPDVRTSRSGKTGTRVQTTRRVAPPRQRDLATEVSGGKIPEVNVSFDGEPSPPISIQSVNTDETSQPNIAMNIVPPAVELKENKSAPPPSVRTGGQVKIQSKPVYPAAARAMKIEGEVVLSAIVDTDGGLKDIRAVSGHPTLIPAATDAAAKMKFVPYQVGNTKVEVPTKVIFNFRLTDSQR